MADINVGVKWSDNTPELTRNLATGLTQVDATQKSIDKLVTSLSGQTQIQAANRWAQALQTLGGEAGALAGVQKLTASETDKATAAVTNAIAKYQALGATAPKALTDIADALKQVGTTSDQSGQKLSGFAKYLDDLKPKTDNAHASFTSMKGTLSEMWDNPTAGAQKLASAVGSDLATGMGSAGVAIGLVSAAAIVAGVAVYELAERAAAVGSNLEDLHNKTGMSVDGLSKLSYAAKVAGGSVDQIANAMFMFEKQAGNDAPKVAQGMALIGLSLDDIKKLAPEDQFTAIATALAHTEEATIRNAAGNDIFGRSFRDLAPLIMKMNDALALTADLNPWTEEEAKLAEEFEMHLASIHAHFDAIGTTLGRTVLPSIERFVAALDEIAHWTPPAWMEKGLSLGMVEQGQGQFQFPTNAELARGTPDNLPPTFLQRGGFPNPLPLPAGPAPAGNDSQIVGATDQQMFKILEGLEEEQQKKSEEVHKKYVSDWQKTDDEIQKIWGEAFVAGAAIDTKSLAGQLAILDQKRINEENAATEQIAERTKSEEQTQMAIAAIRLKYANLDDAAIQAATEKNIEESEAVGLAGAAAVSKAFAGPQLVLKNLLVSMGAVPISLKSILSPTQEMGKLMTDVTVAAKEHFDQLHDAITGDVTDIASKMSSMGVQTRDDLQRTADQFKADYDAMSASGKFTIEELRAAWLRYKEAVSAAHPEMATAMQDLANLGGAINTVSSALTPIANLSPTFAALNTAVGGVAKGIQGIGTAMASIEAVGFNVSNLANLAAGWIGVAVAVVQVAKAIGDAADAASVEGGLAQYNKTLTDEYQSASNFSRQLSDDITKTQAAIAAGGKSWTQFIQDLVKSGTSADFLAATTAIAFAQTASEALHITDIIKELGGVSNLTSAQLATVEGHVRDLFTVIKLGGPLAAQAAKTLDDVLTQMDQNLDPNGRVSQFFTEMVAQARAAGVVLPQVAQFFRDQAATMATGLTDLLSQPLIVNAEAVGKAVSDAQDALDKLKTSGTASAAELTKAQDALTAALEAQHAAGMRDKQALDDLGQEALVTFNAAIASGDTFIQALGKVAPALETIRKAYADIGVAIDDATLKGLVLENTILNGTKDKPSSLGTAISGNQAIVTGAMNFGPAVETPAAFAAQQHTTASLYTQAQAASANAGVTGDAGTAAALMPFQGTLHELDDWAKKNKVELDDNTKQMIAQSQALGIWNDDFKSDSEKTRDSLADVVKSADALATALGGLPAALAAVIAGRAPTSTGGGGTSSGPGGSGDAGRASTGGFVTHSGIATYLVSGGPVGTDTVNAWLTPGESVLTKAATASIGYGTIAAWNSGDTTTGVVPGNDSGITFEQIAAAQAAANAANRIGITDPGQGPGKFPISTGGGWPETDPLAPPPIFGAPDPTGGGSIGAPWTPPDSSWIPPTIWTDMGKAPAVTVGAGGGGPGSPAGNTFHITIQAIDGPSVQRFVRSQEFSDALVSSTAFNKNSMRTGLRAGLGVS